MTFVTTAREAQRSYHVVFPCSLTAPGYQLVKNPEHPNIAEDFESTFAKLGALPCDIFIPQHSSAVELFERSTKRGRGGEKGNPFADPEGYRRWLDNSRAAFHRQLEGQK
jgi:metallo-beta-lactamase class B